MRNLSNNVNIQNFSSADLLGISAGSSGGRRGGGGGGRGSRGGGRGRGGESLGSNTNDFLVAQQGGISTTNAVGINYQDKWGEKLEVVGSYFFNQSENENVSISLEEYFGLESPYTYEETEDATSKNLNHRANLQLRYNFDKNNTLLLRPSLTIQQNKGASSSEASAFSNNNLTNLLMETFITDLNAVKFFNELSFNHRFKKKGRSLSFNIKNGLNTSDGDKFLQSENDNISASELVTLNQNSTLNNRETSWESGVRFSEPIGEKGGLLLGYTYGNQQNEAEVLTFDYNEMTQEFDLLSDNLSNVFNNNYESHRGDLGYRYRSGGLSMMLRTSVQTGKLDNNQTFPNGLVTQKRFNNMLPSASINYRYSKEKSLRISYRSSTKLPTASDLQDVVDNTNPLQLTVGNPNLYQQVNHSVNLRYSANNLEKASVFFAFFQASLIKDYLGKNTFVAGSNDSIGGVVLQEGVQVTQPVNLSGYANTKAFLTYGIPLVKLKSNFNINLGGGFNHTPSQIAGKTIYTNSENVNLGLTLSSNISPEVDFTIGTTSNFDFAQGENVAQASVFYQKTQAKVNYIFLENWHLETNLTHNFYESTNDNFTFWNASIGRKFLEDNRAEIMLSVYDILKRNTAIRQSYTDNSFQQTQSLALQRFFMLGFRYNLRAFDAQPFW